MKPASLCETTSRQSSRLPLASVSDKRPPVCQSSKVCQIERALHRFKLGREVFKVIRVAPGDAELEERYSRKDKSLSQLSKRFLAEFGTASNQVISMFEVTEKLRMIP